MDGPHPTLQALLQTRRPRKATVTSAYCKDSRAAPSAIPERLFVDQRIHPLRREAGGGALAADDDGAGDESVLLRHQAHEVILRQLLLVQAHGAVLHRAPGEELVDPADLRGQ